LIAEGEIVTDKDWTANSVFV